MVLVVREPVEKEPEVPVAPVGEEEQEVAFVEDQAMVVLVLYAREVEPAETVTVGAGVLFTVTATEEEVVVFPAASLAVAVRVWEALVAEVVVQETEYGEVVSSLPRFAPSSLNCTPETPTLSEAEAATVTVPLTVLPAEGEVTETEGGVVSLGGGEPEPATS